MLFLQKAQLSHDEKFHRDVLSLPLQDKVKHILLHLTKYLGKLLTEKNKEVIFSDILICCLALGNSLKNVLNAEDAQNPIDFDVFIYNYAVSLGKMAKSCEALDHIENYPSHAVLIEEINNILSITFSYLNLIGKDYKKIINCRWDYIASKDFLSKDSSYQK